MGNEIGRESVSIGNNEFLRNEAGTKKIDAGDTESEVEEVANGPYKAKGKMQGRKWKLQARATKIERGGTNGPINVKRPNSEVVWPSPESKKMKVSSPIKQIQKVINLSPLKQAYNHIEHSPYRAPRRLKLTNEELEAKGNLKAMEEDLLAGAGC